MFCFVSLRVKQNSKLTFTGVKMVPISWCEMQCPKTHVKEHRKVAKVQPEYIEYSDR